MLLSLYLLNVYDFELERVVPAFARHQVERPALQDDRALVDALEAALADRDRLQREAPQCPGLRHIYIHVEAANPRPQDVILHALFLAYAVEIVHVAAWQLDVAPLGVAAV